MNASQIANGSVTEMESAPRGGWLGQAGGVTEMESAPRGWLKKDGAVATEMESAPRGGWVSRG